MKARASDGKLQDYRGKIIRVEEEIKRVVLGIDDIVEAVVLAIFARGHTLFDGLPGTGKTLLCFAASRALGGDALNFDGRPDFLPNQFLYVTEPDENGVMRFYDGPLITRAETLVGVVLDEVTRYLHQSQAFWLRILNTGVLPLHTRKIQIKHLRLFASKNKVTRGETFDIIQPLFDRFMINKETHYPEAEKEKRIITDEALDELEEAVSVVNPVLENLDELERITDCIQSSVQISRAMTDYLYEVVNATRHPSRYGVKLEGISNIDSLVDNSQNASGVSPRGGAKWRRISKVAAFRRGSEHLLPQDVLGVDGKFAESVLAHRIFVNPRAGGDRNRSMLAKDFLRAVLDKVEAPNES